MAGLTNAESAATLDVRFPTTGATDYIAWSANGTSETGFLARTAVGSTGWAAVRDRPHSGWNPTHHMDRCRGR